VTGRQTDCVTGQIMEEGGCPFHSRPIEVKPIEVRIHGEWGIWIWVGFRDLMGIDPSALGDGRGQRTLIRLPHGKRVAWKTGQPFQAGLPVNADWTEQIMFPIDKFWWGESDLHSPLARLDSRALVREVGTRRVRNHQSKWTHDR